MDHKATKQNIFGGLLVCVFILNVLCFHSGYARPNALHHKIKHCCDQHTKSSGFNKTDCFRQIESVLSDQKLTFTRSYKYTKKLWRSMSSITKEHETRNLNKLERGDRLSSSDTSFLSWSVSASQPESASFETLVFQRQTPQAITDLDGRKKQVNTFHLTRMELLIPFYYVHPDRGCRKNSDGETNVSVSYKGTTYYAMEGIMPYKNMLVFLLPQAPTEDGSEEKMVVALNTSQDFMFIHPKGSMLLEFYNIDDNAIATMRNKAVKRAKSKAASTNANDKRHEKDRSMSSGRRSEGGVQQSTRQKRSTARNKSSRTYAPNNQQLCRAYSYFVNANDLVRFRHIEYPKKINIGKCSGNCNALTLELSDAYSTGRSVLLNLLRLPDVTEVSQCVPRYMQSLTIMLTTSPFHVKVCNVHSTRIMSCRCT